MTPQGTAGASAGIGVLSSVIGGIGGYEAGKAEKSAYDYNADITMQNMRDQMLANQQTTTARIGKQASSYAASGVDIQSGSPLLIMIATAARGAQQGQQIEDAGTEQSNLQRYYGKLAAFKGTMSGINTFLSGISKTATGFFGATAGTPSPSSGGGTYDPSAPDMG